MKHPRCRMALAVLLFAAAGLVRAEAITPLAGSPLAEVVEEALRGGGGDPATGNRLAMVSSGYDALLLRVHLIRHAQKSVAIQTFIWTNDEVGRLIMYELIQAAKRGVQVRIIADHMVSDQDPATMAFLATVHPNLRVKHYRPAMSRIKPSLADNLLSGVLGFHDLNQRMHNKILLVDDVALVTGGRNIENTYFDHSTEMNFRDRDVLAIGPVARLAAASFEKYWDYRHAVSSEDLKDVAAVMASGKYPHFETREDFGFGAYFRDLDHQADDPAEIRARIGARLREVRSVKFIADEPGKTKGRFFFSETAQITRALREVIGQGRSSLTLQTPYLVLSPPARELFKKMMKKHPGLRIRISSNSFASTDNIMAYSANYRLRNSYVEGLGLEIHEYKALPTDLLKVFPQYPVMKQLADEKIAKGVQKRTPFLCIHAKSLVVDDRIAFVGSYNLDPRSETLNTEVGLLVEDPVFAGELKAEIERDMSSDNSWVIAKRALPLGLDTVNGLVDSLLSLSPIDVWPIQNTSSYELRPGATEVPPDHPDFYKNYREAGSFPGSEGLLSQKEIVTRLYKAVGAPLTPIL